MSTENKIFKMSLDVSDLISNYKRAIQTMQDLGGPVKAITSFEQQIRKLENEFSILQKKGQEGIGKDPSSVKSYTKEVDKAYNKLVSLGNEITKLGSDRNSFNINAVRDLEREITRLNRQAENFRNTFSQGLRNIGFDRNVSNEIAQTTRTEQNLLTTLENELAVRQQISHETQEQARIAREQVAAQIVGRSSNFINTAPTAATGLTANARNLIGEAIDAEVVEAANVNDFIQQLNARITQGIRNGQNFVEVWRNIRAELTNITGLNTNEIFGDINAVSLKVRAAFQAMDEAMNRNTNPAARAAANAADQVHQIETIIAEVRNGTSPLLHQMNELALAEQSVVDAENQRGAAVQQDIHNTETLQNSYNNLTSATIRQQNAQKKEIQSLVDTSTQIKRTETAISKFANMIGSMFSIYTIFSRIRSEIRKTYEDIKTLDKSFASIAMVTDKSVSDMWGTYEQYANMASELGQKTNSVIEASALYYQQGLDTNEALELTTHTMKLATLANENYKTATEEMTAAIRGFRMEMDNGSHVTDVYSTLAASAAASVNDIASAISRTASIANSAGSSFENTSAFLTKMIETTQESAENIGTSLKTVIARFTEMKKNISGTDESEFEDLDVNKVETALKSVGVQLRDTTGQIRDFDDIIVDLGGKWDTLSRNAQRYVATIAAGSRQQSRLIALLDDFDRTIELMDIAAESEGKADEQFAKYADTMEYKLNQLSTEWEKFKTGIIQEDLFKNSIANLTEFINKLNQVDFSDKFNIGGAIANIGLMITGISKSIGLMRTMASTTSAAVVSIKGKVPDLIGKGVYQKQIQKIKLEPVLDDAQLKSELNKLQNVLNNKKLDFQNLLAIKPAVSYTDQMLAQYLGKNNIDHFAQAVQLTERETIELKNAIESIKASEGITSTTQAFKLLRERAQETVGALRQWEQEANKLELEEQEIKDKVQQATNAIDQNTAAQERNNAKMQEGAVKADQLSKKVVNFAKGGINLLSSGLSTALTYIPMMASGMMSVGDAVKMAGLQMGVMAAQQQIMSYATAFQTVLTENEIIAKEGLTLANWKLAASEAAAAAPVAAFVLAIGALVAVIGGLVYAMKKWNDANDETKKATQTLITQQEKLKEIQEQRVQTKAEKSSTKKEAEETEKLKNEWLELSKVRNKTTEQQERETELIEKVKEKFPEVINYYDQINNKLDLSIEKWEKIIEKQKEAAGKSAKADYITAVEENEQQRNAKIAQANVDYIGQGHEYWENINNRRELAQKYITENQIYFSDVYSNEQIRTELENINIDEELIKVMEEALGKKLETTSDIIDAIFDTGLTQKIAIKASKAYKEYKDKVDEINQEFDENSKTIFSNYIDSIEENVAVAEITKKLIESNKDIIDYNKEYSNYSNDLKKDFKDNVVGLGEFSNLKSRTKDLLKAKGIETEEDFNNNYSEEELLDLVNLDIEISAYQKYIDQAEKEIGNKESEFLEKVLTGSIDLTEKELDEKIDNLNLSGNDINKAYAQVYSDLLTDLEKTQDQLDNIYGKKDWSNYGQKLKTFASASQSILDAFNSKTKESDLKTQGEEFLSSIGSILYNLGPETSSALLNNNFYKNYNPLDEQGFKNSIEKVLKETGEKTKDEANEIFKEISQKAKDSGIISTEINISDIKDYAEKVIKVQEAFKDVKEELYNLTQKGKENVVISAEQLESYEKLEEALKEAGVSDTDLLNEESGQWTLNVKKANEILNQYGEDAIKKLKEYQAQEALEIKGLELRANDLNEEEKTRYAVLLENSKEYEKQIELIQAAADKTASVVNYLSQISTLSSSVSTALSNFSKNKILSSSDIASLQKGFAAYGIDAGQFINKNLGIANPEQLYKTALTQLQNAIKSGKLNDEELLQAKAEIASLYASWIDYLQETQEEADKLAETEKKNTEDREKLLEKIKEAEKKLREQEEDNAKDREKDLENIKKAEEDIEKARKDYQDQLETIEEKQKAINDAIEKYNELLYGSANRKGKLDLFYNYEQALSSLTDTMSRAEEKLGIAQDIDSATEALNNYAIAAKNLIATEKAKQVSIQAGLANYANMIENGSASYTNRETGQQIGIRFGDYARKDKATGKYILNQRLLNQAKFNDEYKNLIEENIETYNKYLDEYNKINDEIAKKEKEFQEKRKQALKAYSDFEKSIADALKAQYEDEVEDLKDKYDSMKAADDDYLDALEDAINKQRQLREKEEKYESLAEQEKKLSLLSRDTSGSRTLDVNKLRKDVDKTRKQLLDEAVDEIVDGLKKLAKENEETRQVEMELRDAIVENTNHWNWQAEAIAPTFTNADDYANYMAGMNSDFEEMSWTQQQVQLQEYKDQFAEAVEYSAWNMLDAASGSGDAIVDIVDVSTESVMAIVSEKTTAFSDEVIRSYDEISQKVQDDLKNQEEAIDSTRDALQDAIEKLDELQEKINETIEKLSEMQKTFEENEIKRAEKQADAQKAIDDAWKELNEKNAELLKAQQKKITEEKKTDLSNIVPSESNSPELNPSSVIPEVSPEQKATIPTGGDAAQGPRLSSVYKSAIASHPYHPSMEGKTLNEAIDLYNNYRNSFNEQKSAGKSTTDTAVAMQNVKEVIEDILGLKGDYSLKDINATLERINISKTLAFKEGGLVNYTGPAWVDGTPARPEAFLSAADTKAIGDAVRILSDLSIIRDYDNLGSITNNTIGDTSIEINLNIENLSSDIDIDNMLERVKEEIVSVANPVGINTILKQS